VVIGEPLPDVAQRNVRWPAEPSVLALIGGAVVQEGKGICGVTGRRQLDPEMDLDAVGMQDPVPLAADVTVAVEAARGAQRDRHLVRQAPDGLLLASRTD
jgi:hypothetical protein